MATTRRTATKSAEVEATEQAEASRVNLANNAAELATEAEQVRDAAYRVQDWLTTLDPEQTELFLSLHTKYSHTTVPTTAALLEYFGINPNTVPSYNGFFTNGYIVFRARTEGDEMTLSGYRDVQPKLHDWPEGLSFELAQAAQRYDSWGL